MCGVIVRLKSNVVLLHLLLVAFVAGYWRGLARQHARPRPHFHWSALASRFSSISRLRFCARSVRFIVFKSSPSFLPTGAEGSEREGQPSAEHQHELEHEHEHEHEGVLSGAEHVDSSDELSPTLDPIPVTLTMVLLSC